MMLICVHFRGNDSGTFVSSAQGETLNAQITRDVRDAVNTLHESVSLRDWITSGYTPADVLNNVKSFNDNSANLALCDVLKGLPISELALFQDTLKKESFEESTENASLTCTGALINRIQDHWQELLSAQKNSIPDPSQYLTTEVKKLKPGETEIDSTMLNSGEFMLVFEGSIDSSQTSQILEKLQSFKAQGMFLIPANSARGQASTIKLLLQAGETLGSQSTEEEDMTTLPTDEADKKLQEGAQKLSHLTGQRSKFFSFPFSQEDVTLSPLQEFTRTQGMVQVLPNMDSEDWKTLDPQALAQNVASLTAKTSHGIILLHSRLEQTTLALPQILKTLALQHRKLVLFK